MVAGPPEAPPRAQPVASAMHRLLLAGLVGNTLVPTTTTSTEYMTTVSVCSLVTSCLSVNSIRGKRESLGILGTVDWQPPFMPSLWMEQIILMSTSADKGAWCGIRVALQDRERWRIEFTRGNNNETNLRRHQRSVLPSMRLPKSLKPPLQAPITAAVLCHPTNLAVHNHAPHASHLLRRY